jgi:nucleoside-diphosphate-sugar epimerase
MKIRAIITGATGMVGEGVLNECLNNDNVEQVLVIGRKPSGYIHPKLKEIIHADFLDISSLTSQLTGYNACYFCLGVSAIGKKEPEYTKFTYTLTINFATALAKLNPDMTFCYISGTGTDSSEKGRIMWARVKGKTENDLMKIPFKQVYNFRPAVIKTTLPVKPSQTYYKTYKYAEWIFPVLKFLAPDYVTSLKDLAIAMINSSTSGYSKSVLEVKDINYLATKQV